MRRAASLTVISSGRHRRRTLPGWTAIYIRASSLFIDRFLIGLKLGGFPALRRLIEVVGGLKVHPELGGGAERLGEVERGIRGNPALVLDQLVQTRARPAELLGKLGLRDFAGLEEFLKQNLCRDEMDFSVPS